MWDGRRAPWRPKRRGFRGRWLAHARAACWHAARVCLVCSHTRASPPFTLYSMHDMEDKVRFSGETRTRAPGGRGGAGRAFGTSRAPVSPPRPTLSHLPPTFPPPQAAAEDAPVAEEVMVKDVVDEEVRGEGWKEGGRVAAAGLGARARRAHRAARRKKSRFQKYFNQTLSKHTHTHRSPPPPKKPPLSPPSPPSWRPTKR